MAKKRLLSPLLFFKEIAYCQGPFPLEEYIKIIFNLYSIFWPTEGIQRHRKDLTFAKQIKQNCIPTYFKHIVIHQNSKQKNNSI